MAGLHGALQGRSVPCMQVEHDALNPGLFNHSQQLTGHISFHRNPVNLTLGCFGSERVSHIAFWNQKLLLEKTQRFRRKWKAAACQCYDPDCYSKVDSGHDQVELHFCSEFRFSAGPLYRAPPLLVDTVLTTEISKGLTRQGTGSRLDSNGNCVLVGTARISPVNDAFLDKFLMLPTDVLAVLPSNFKLFPPPH
eukprot:TRINITY_DN1547_c0_g1_i3.p1 TRINITY_DN1547_c0_g1~~TRINITY_DN1547_c0_g1_i3.p1  ORF type:complete len:194 (+),score=20.09 TRINITY_DN1547_c0_g1_i3:49-630(+)